MDKQLNSLNSRLANLQVRNQVQYYFKLSRSNNLFYLLETGRQESTSQL
jgi:hypothetical protein